MSTTYQPTTDWQQRAAQEAEAQLKELDRQSGFLPKLAHLTAGALLFAASAGSLISISAAPFAKFLAALNAGSLDAVDFINLSVNLLLVLAGDVTLLYAASMLRTLKSTGAPKAETRGHTRAMWFAAALETGTYLYLVWLFDKPTNPLLWAIAIGRAISWPIFSMYLSMARPLPVAPRDVAYNASVASGRGVVRDVTILANDPNAPLHRKVRIYRASSRMHPEDRAMFDDVITAVSEESSTQPNAASSAASSAHPIPALPAPADAPFEQVMPSTTDEHPTTPTTPLDPPVPTPRGPRHPPTGELSATHDGIPAQMMRSNVPVQPSVRPSVPTSVPPFSVFSRKAPRTATKSAKPARADTGRTRSHATRARISDSTAQEIRNTLLAEQHSRMRDAIGE